MMTTIDIRQLDTMSSSSTHAEYHAQYKAFAITSALRRWVTGYYRPIHIESSVMVCDGELWGDAAHTARKCLVWFERLARTRRRKGLAA